MSTVPASSPSSYVYEPDKISPRSSSPIMTETDIVTLSHTQSEDHGMRNKLVTEERAALNSEHGGSTNTLETTTVSGTLAIETKSYESAMNNGMQYREDRENLYYLCNPCPISITGITTEETLSEAVSEQSRIEYNENGHQKANTTEKYHQLAMLQKCVIEEEGSPYGFVSPNTKLDNLKHQVEEHSSRNSGFLGNSTVNELGLPKHGTIFSTAAQITKIPESRKQASTEAQLTYVSQTTRGWNSYELYEDMSNTRSTSVLPDNYMDSDQSYICNPCPIDVKKTSEEQLFKTSTTNLYNNTVVEVDEQEDLQTLFEFNMQTVWPKHMPTEGTKYDLTEKQSSAAKLFETKQIAESSLFRTDDRFQTELHLSVPLSTELLSESTGEYVVNTQKTTQYVEKSPSELQISSEIGPLADETVPHSSEEEYTDSVPSSSITRTDTEATVEPHKSEDEIENINLHKYGLDKVITISQKSLEEIDTSPIVHSSRNNSEENVPFSENERYSKVPSEYDYATTSQQEIYNKEKEGAYKSTPAELNNLNASEIDQASQMSTSAPELPDELLTESSQIILTPSANATEAGGPKEVKDMPTRYIIDSSEFHYITDTSISSKTVEFQSPSSVRSFVTRIVEENRLTQTESFAIPKETSEMSTISHDTFAADEEVPETEEVISHFSTHRLSTLTSDRESVTQLTGTTAGQLGKEELEHTIEAAAPGETENKASNHTGRTDYQKGDQHTSNNVLTVGTEYLESTKRLDARVDTNNTISRVDNTISEDVANLGTTSGHPSPSVIKTVEENEMSFQSEPKESSTKSTISHDEFAADEEIQETGELTTHFLTSKFPTTKFTSTSERVSVTALSGATTGELGVEAEGGNVTPLPAETEITYTERTDNQEGASDIQRDQEEISKLYDQHIWNRSLTVETTQGLDTGVDTKQLVFGKTISGRGTTSEETTRLADENVSTPSLKDISFETNSLRSLGHTTSKLSMNLTSSSAAAVGSFATKTVGEDEMSFVIQEESSIISTISRSTFIADEKIQETGVFPSTPESESGTPQSGTTAGEVGKEELEHIVEGGNVTPLAAMPVETENKSPSHTEATHYQNGATKMYSGIPLDQGAEVDTDQISDKTISGIDSTRKDATNLGKTTALADENVSISSLKDISLGLSSSSTISTVSHNTFIADENIKETEEVTSHFLTHKSLETEITERVSGTTAGELGKEDLEHRMEETETVEENEMSSETESFSILEEHSTISTISYNTLNAGEQIHEAEEVTSHFLTHKSLITEITSERESVTPLSGTTAGELGREELEHRIEETETVEENEMSSQTESFGILEGNSTISTISYNTLTAGEQIHETEEVTSHFLTHKSFITKITSESESVTPLSGTTAGELGREELEHRIEETETVEENEMSSETESFGILEENTTVSTISYSTLTAGEQIHETEEGTSHFLTHKSPITEITSERESVTSLSGTTAGELGKEELEHRIEETETVKENQLSSETESFGILEENTTVSTISYSTLTAGEQIHETEERTSHFLTHKSPITEITSERESVTPLSGTTAGEQGKEELEHRIEGTETVEENEMTSETESFGILEGNSTVSTISYNTLTAGEQIHETEEVTSHFLTHKSPITEITSEREPVTPLSGTTAGELGKEELGHRIEGTETVEENEMSSETQSFGILEGNSTISTSSYNTLTAGEQIQETEEVASPFLTHKSPITEIASERESVTSLSGTTASELGKEELEHRIEETETVEENEMSSETESFGILEENSTVSTISYNTLTAGEQTYETEEGTSHFLTHKSPITEITPERESGTTAGELGKEELEHRIEETETVEENEMSSETESFGILEENSTVSTISYSTLTAGEQIHETEEGTSHFLTHKSLITEITSERESVTPLLGSTAGELGKEDLEHRIEETETVEENEISYETESFGILEENSTISTISYSTLTAGEQIHETEERTSHFLTHKSLITEITSERESVTALSGTTAGELGKEELEHRIEETETVEENEMSSETESFGILEENSTVSTISYNTLTAGEQIHETEEGTSHFLTHKSLITEITSERESVTPLLGSTAGELGKEDLEHRIEETETVEENEISYETESFGILEENSTISTISYSTLTAGEQIHETEERTSHFLTHKSLITEITSERESVTALSGTTASELGKEELEHRIEETETVEENEMSSETESFGILEENSTVSTISYNTLTAGEQTYETEEGTSHFLTHKSPITEITPERESGTTAGELGKEELEHRIEETETVEENEMSSQTESFGILEGNSIISTISYNTLSAGEQIHETEEGTSHFLTHKSPITEITTAGELGKEDLEHRIEGTETVEENEMSFETESFGSLEENSTVSTISYSTLTAGEQIHETEEGTTHFLTHKSPLTETTSERESVTPLSGTTAGELGKEELEHRIEETETVEENEMSSETESFGILEENSTVSTISYNTLTAGEQIHETEEVTSPFLTHTSSITEISETELVTPLSGTTTGELGKEELEPIIEGGNMTPLAAVPIEMENKSSSHTEHTDYQMGATKMYSDNQPDQEEALKLHDYDTSNSENVTNLRKAPSLAHENASIPSLKHTSLKTNSLESATDETELDNEGSHTSLTSASVGSLVTKIVEENETSFGTGSFAIMEENSTISAISQKPFVADENVQEREEVASPFLTHKSLTTEISESESVTSLSGTTTEELEPIIEGGNMTPLFAVRIEIDNNSSSHTEHTDYQKGATKMYSDIEPDQEETLELYEQHTSNRSSTIKTKYLKTTQGLGTGTDTKQMVSDETISGIDATREDVAANTPGRANETVSTPTLENISLEMNSLVSFGDTASKQSIKPTSSSDSSDKRVTNAIELNNGSCEIVVKTVGQNETSVIHNTSEFSIKSTSSSGNSDETATDEKELKNESSHISLTSPSVGSFDIKTVGEDEKSFQTESFAIQEENSTISTISHNTSIADEEIQKTEETHKSLVTEFTSISERESVTPLSGTTTGELGKEELEHIVEGGNVTPLSPMPVETENTSPNHTGHTDYQMGATKVYSDIQPDQEEDLELYDQPTSNRSLTSETEYLNSTQELSTSSSDNTDTMVTVGRELNSEESIGMSTPEARTTVSGALVMGKEATEIGNKSAEHHIHTELHEEDHIAEFNNKSTPCEYCDEDSETSETMFAKAFTRESEESSSFKGSHSILPISSIRSEQEVESATIDHSDITHISEVSDQEVETEGTKEVDESQTVSEMQQSSEEETISSESSHLQGPESTEPSVAQSRPFTEGESSPEVTGESPSLTSLSDEADESSSVAVTPSLHKGSTEVNLNTSPETLEPNDSEEKSSFAETEKIHTPLTGSSEIEKSDITEIISSESSESEQTQFSEESTVALETETTSKSISSVSSTSERTFSTENTDNDIESKSDTDILHEKTHAAPEYTEEFIGSIQEGTSTYASSAVDSEYASDNIEPTTELGTQELASENTSVQSSEHFSEEEKISESSLFIGDTSKYVTEKSPVSSVEEEITRLSSFHEENHISDQIGDNHLSSHIHSHEELASASSMSENLHFSTSYEITYLSEEETSTKYESTTMHEKEASSGIEISNFDMELTNTVEIENKPIGFETTACEYCNSLNIITMHPTNTSISGGGTTEKTDHLSTIEVENGLIGFETTPCEFCHTGKLTSHAPVSKSEEGKEPHSGSERANEETQSEGTAQVEKETETVEQQLSEIEKEHESSLLSGTTTEEVLTTEASSQAEGATSSHGTVGSEIITTETTEELETEETPKSEKQLQINNENQTEEDLQKDEGEQSMIVTQTIEESHNTYQIKGDNESSEAYSGKPESDESLQTNSTAMSEVETEAIDELHTKEVLQTKEEYQSDIQEQATKEYETNNVTQGEEETPAVEDTQTTSETETEEKTETEGVPQKESEQHTEEETKTEEGTGAEVGTLSQRDEIENHTKILVEKTSRSHYTHGHEISLSTEGNIKPVIIIVNNSKGKHQKLNKSFLEYIMSTSVPDAEIQYVDLNSDNDENLQHLWKNETTEANKSYTTCNKTDFEGGKNCFCHIQDYLDTLVNRITNRKSIDSTKNYCGSYIKLKNGLQIHKPIKPGKRQRRGLIYMDNIKRKEDYLQYDSNENIFDGDFQLTLTGKTLFQLPGENVGIPCSSLPENVIHEGEEMVWMFYPLSSTEGELLPEKGQELLLHDISVKNAGNYTCLPENKKGVPENQSWHELELITFPIYHIVMNIFYEVNDSCNLQDGDILHAYLPKIASPILCTDREELCSIQMERPRCLTREDNNYFNVTMTAKMNSNFVLRFHDRCDTNCKLKTYENMVNIIYRNSEILERIPVHSHLEETHDVDFIPHLEGKEGSPVIVKPPKVIVSCPDGFGLESRKQRVCVICPAQTFSNEDEAFCRKCPGGQYQPHPGSKSCIQCNSPVDDKMCLRMLYSDTKLFKIYVGVAFGAIVLMVIIIVVWTSGMNDSRVTGDRHYEGSLRHRAAISRKDADLEIGANEPLLRQSPRRIPPQLPPIDF